MKRSGLFVLAFVLPVVAYAEEQLRTAPLNGWKEGTPVTQGDFRVRNWSDVTNDQLALRIESIRQRPIPSPAELTSLAAAARQRACPRFSSTTITADPENGYPTQLNLMTCASGKDAENTPLEMLKAIQGEDLVYLVSLQLRGPTSEADQLAQVKLFTEFMRTVVLCNDTPAHPCPPNPPRLPMLDTSTAE